MESTDRPSPSAGSTAPIVALLAVLLLGVGALCVGLVSAPYKSFDLDRFFVPKELALHATALLVALPLVIRRRQLTFSGIDVLLALFLGLSVLSGLFAANYWLAARSVAVTWSSLVLFWSMTAVAAGVPRRERTVMAVLVLAILVTAMTALVQAYGIDSVHFSVNRAPGGTLGNRNFVAHLAAIATPLLVIAAVGARRRLSSVVATSALALVSAVLVLSRSRAAWLALAACVVVLFPGVWRARVRWNVVGMRRRLVANLGVVALTVVGAVFIPNALDWNSDSPYLDSVKSMTDYTAGSGRGRLVQYENSLELALHHPLLGVGPGNWAVAYPAIVKPNDPSLDHDSGMTENPWPSSDWMAFVSERGPAAAILLALACLLLVADAGRQMLAAEALGAYLRGLALAGLVIATTVVGLFDAVLLLPAPALIAFAAMGALRSPPRRRPVALGRRGRFALVAGVLVVGALATTRNALMVAAMGQYERGAIADAARDDPASYRIQMRLADAARSRGRCDLVRRHAGAARTLYPHAPEPRRLLAACARSAGR
jgi:O-antigen ligase